MSYHVKKYKRWNYHYCRDDEKVPQSPFNQSTKAPEDAAKVVRPAVPIEANNAY